MIEQISLAVAIIAALASACIAFMADHRSKEALKASERANGIAGAANSLTESLAAAASAERMRARRAAFAADFIVWINSGAVHLLTGRTAMSHDREFIDEGSRLSAQAQVIDEPRANDFLVTLRNASTRMESIPESRRADVTTFTNGLLELAISGWVDDPEKLPADLDAWLASFIDAAPETRAC